MTDFILGDHFINSHNLSLESAWILVEEIRPSRLQAPKGMRKTFLSITCD